jgi:hypothetical protein
VIDFRYHLVSIIAVFLALAIGLAVGSTYLPSAVEGSLQRAEAQVKARNDRLLQANTQLNQESGVNQAFAQAARPRLLRDLLPGQSVVLITAPSASGQVISGVTSSVELAGATVTGQVTLQAQFFDSSESAETKLASLAQSLAPDAGITLSGSTSGSAVGAQAEAAEVLATALISNTVDGGLSSEQIAAILGGFAQSGYLQVSAANGGSAALPPATAAVVIAPATPPSASASSPANLALIAVAQQLETASHATVLASSLAGAGAGSVISQASGSGSITTVDNADQPLGQIITVQALWELLAGHAPSSYGVGPDAVPSPAPTPSASSSSSPSPSSTPSGKKSR